MTTQDEDEWEGRGESWVVLPCSLQNSPVVAGMGAQRACVSCLIPSGSPGLQEEAFSKRVIPYPTTLAQASRMQGSQSRQDQLLEGQLDPTVS